MASATEWESILRAAAAVDDDALDVAQVALALAAADHPSEDLESHRDHLDRLAEPLGGVQPDAAALSARIAGRFGYRGDSETYDDTRNADLIEVIRRRRGLPVALGILYMHAARAQGWTIAGLNFPGHFLLRLGTGEETAIIDPFFAGRVLTVGQVGEMLAGMAGPKVQLQPAHMATVPARHVLMRLLNNIKLRALQSGNRARADEILRRTSLFAPGEAAPWLERAELAAHEGNLIRARELIAFGIGAVAPGPMRDWLVEAQARYGRQLN
ncbi:MAG: transglutaminase-like domain-containing protein [Pseudomonadota bacterium]|nr:transglutaminase-like domain-containing protein [Pseudomonadota bacterium]